MLGAHSILLAQVLLWIMAAAMRKAATYAAGCWPQGYPAAAASWRGVTGDVRLNRQERLSTKHSRNSTSALHSAATGLSPCRMNAIQAI